MSASEERAARAHETLEAHMDMTGSSNVLVQEENVIDLLTDLRHYCRQQEMDFDSAVRMSEMHFEREA